MGDYWAKQKIELIHFLNKYPIIESQKVIKLIKYFQANLKLFNWYLTHKYSNIHYGQALTISIELRI